MLAWERQEVILSSRASSYSSVQCRYPTGPPRLKASIAKTSSYTGRPDRCSSWLLAGMTHKFEEAAQNGNNTLSTDPGTCSLFLLTQLSPKPAEGKEKPRKARTANAFCKPCDESCSGDRHWTGAVNESPLPPTAQSKEGRLPFAISLFFLFYPPDNALTLHVSYRGLQVAANLQRKRSASAFPAALYVLAGGRGGCRTASVCGRVLGSFLRLAVSVRDTDKAGI